MSFHFLKNMFLINTLGLPTWILLDGDKIAALMAILLKQELEAAGLLDTYTCAVVQTAYANGASTQFLRSLGVPIHITKTGVKYLHHKAQEFDVGIYFEANGHGTVVFSELFVQAVSSYTLNGCSNSGSGGGGDDSAGHRKDVAYARLRASTLLINPAVGDAISDMLYCMAALQVSQLALQPLTDAF